MFRKMTFIWIAMIFGVFFSTPTLATDDKIEAMSAPRFWAKVMGKEVDAGKDVDYIICGANICNSSEKEEVCMVKEEIRKDHITEFRGAAGGIILDRLIYVIRGDGTVATYDYKCAKGSEIDTYKKRGWKEAPEGGFVQRRKTRTGGILAKEKTKEKSCYTGNDQKEYCLLTKEKGSEITRATVSYNKANTAFRRCEVLPVKLYNARQCFFCPLFTKMYAVSNHITSLSFSRFAIPFANVIAIGLAIWVAIQVLVFVSSITKQDAPKFLTNLIKQSYKFVIAFVMLISSMQIYDIAIVPIMRSGLKFGSQMLGNQYTVKTLATGLTDWEAMENINPGIKE